MTDETRSTINTLYEAIQDLMVYLYSRWQSERAHENFADYSDRVRHEIDKLNISAEFSRLGKRPFCAVVHVKTWVVYITVSSREYKWSAKHR